MFMLFKIRSSSQQAAPAIGSIRQFAKVPQIIALRR
jgi:hypothetical protein